MEKKISCRAGPPKIERAFWLLCIVTLLFGDLHLPEYVYYLAYINIHLNFEYRNNHSLIRLLSTILTTIIQFLIKNSIFFLVRLHASAQHRDELASYSGSTSSSSQGPRRSRHHLSPVQRKQNCFRIRRQHTQGKINYSRQLLNCN